MKREKFSAFFKTKGFYVSLFSGICAVFVLTMVYANVRSIQKQNEQNIQENVETPNQMTPSETGQSAIGTEPDATNKQDVAKVTEENNATQKPKDSVEPSKEVPAKTENEDKLAQVENPDKQGTQVAQTGPELESQYGESLDMAPTGTTNENQNAIQNLSFQEEKGILWPVEGNIIKNYSMEKLVYFETLAQYKCNPAILIAAAPGTEVLCGAKGVVTAITQSDEIGNTVLMDIGNGYQLKYAQLTDLTVNVGDVVEEGAVIAKVSEPTIYYSVEGSNLYFQVLQDGETVNPLLLLR